MSKQISGKLVYDPENEMGKHWTEIRNSTSQYVLPTASSIQDPTHTPPEERATEDGTRQRQVKR